MAVTLDYIGKNSEKINIDKSMSVKKLLESLNINPVSVLVMRDNQLIPEDVIVNDGDELKIFSVVSGG